MCMALLTGLNPQSEAADMCHAASMLVACKLGRCYCSADLLCRACAGHSVRHCPQSYSTSSLNSQGTTMTACMLQTQPLTFCTTTHHRSCRTHGMIPCRCLPCMAYRLKHAGLGGAAGAVAGVQASCCTADANVKGSCCVAWA